MTEKIVTEHDFYLLGFYTLSAAIATYFFGPISAHDLLFYALLFFTIPTIWKLRQRQKEADDE